MSIHEIDPARLREADQADRFDSWEAVVGSNRFSKGYVEAIISTCELLKANGLNNHKPQPDELLSMAYKIRDNLKLTVLSGFKNLGKSVGNFYLQHLSSLLVRLEQGPGITQPILPYDHEAIVEVTQNMVTQVRGIYPVKDGDKFDPDELLAPQLYERLKAASEKLGS